MLGRFIVTIVFSLLLFNPAAAKSIKCFYDFGSHKEFVVVSENNKNSGKINIKKWNEGDYEGEPSVFKDINSRGGVFVIDKTQNSSSRETPIWPVIGFVDFSRNIYGSMFVFDFKNIIVGDDVLVKHGRQRTPWNCERLD